LQRLEAFGYPARQDGQAPAADAAEVEEMYAEVHPKPDCTSGTTRPRDREREHGVEEEAGDVIAMISRTIGIRTSHAAR
jgi:hypothetical protein